MGGSISSENTRTNITISKELKSQLEELAKKDNRSFNNYVITVLKEHVDNLNKQSEMPFMSYQIEVFLTPSILHLDY